MIEESYVSIDTAQKLKEAGFDVPCRSYYEIEDGEVVRHDTIRPYDHNGFDDNVCSRPTQALAARWLREVKGIYVEVCVVINGMYGCRLFRGSRADMISDKPYLFETYEEALADGIKTALRRIRQ